MQIMFLPFLLMMNNTLLPDIRISARQLLIGKFVFHLLSPSPSFYQKAYKVSKSKENLKWIFFTDLLQLFVMPSDTPAARISGFFFLNIYQ